MGRHIYHGLLIILSCVLLVATIVGVNQTLDLQSTKSNDTQSTPVLGIDFFRDETKNHYLVSVMTQVFTPIEGQTLSLGYTQDNVWLRVHLPAELSHNKEEMRLVVNPSYLDEVNAYIPLADGRYVVYQAGDQVEHDAQLSYSRMATFPVSPFEGWESKPIYIKLSSRNVIMLDVSLSSQSSFEASEKHYLFWFAVLFGFVFLASLSSIIIWLKSDDDLFVYYALYLALDLVLIVAVYGFWILVLPAGSNDLILGITQTVIVFPLLVIIARVSNFPKHFPFLYRVLLLQTILLALFGPFFIVLGYFQPVIPITHVFVVMLSILWFVMSLLLIKKEPMAPLVLIIFITFLIGSISSYAMHFRLLPLNFITQNLILFGFVLQALLLYIVLGYRMQYLLQDRKQFEARAQSVEDEVVQRRLFMNMLNHELRTPMAIIDSAARNLLVQSDQTSVMTLRLEKIGLAVSDMRQLMDLCLATDRLCFVNNDNQSCSLEKLLESVLAHVSSRHDAERILYEGLDDDIRILGDEPLLVLAISTVLDNALNYSDSSQDVLLQVSRPNKALVRLTIVDKGRGFDKKFVLGKRQRGDNVGDVAGLGMGLAMAHEIVSKHRGRLWVESTSCRGSVVSIELNCLGYLRHLSNGYGVILYS